MIPAQVIARKRDGLPLSESAIAEFISGYTRGEIDDHQMAALAMAIFLQGMELDEVVALTRHMLASGEQLTWRQDGFPKVDKHSTGGLGDKTSLILAPLLACCDLQVPMISGRGLGFTGGTLDKLEAIPGFRTALTRTEIEAQTERIGCVICAATEQISPADRKLYALRDVTGTVESIPLITASILSKKLAESLDCLVLDVKFGSGAFMQTMDEARRLAQTLVAVACRLGVSSSALLTDMNQPLGRMVGNAVEVHESVDVLQGRGPQDVRDLTCGLAAELLVNSGREADRDQATRRLQDALDSGQAFARFEQMVLSQGGRLPAVPAAPARPILAQESGIIQAIDGRRLGEVIIELGGGRKRVADQIDPAVGLEMCVRLGQAVDRDQPLLNLFAEPASFARIEPLLRDAFDIDSSGATPVTSPPLIAEIIAAHPDRPSLPRDEGVTGNIQPIRETTHHERSD